MHVAMGRRKALLFLRSLILWNGPWSQLGAMDVSWRGGRCEEHWMNKGP